MANKGPRIKVKLVSTGKNQKGRKTGYYKTTVKNSRNTTEKLSLKKYDPRAWDAEKSKLGAYVEFKEEKIKSS